MSGRILAYQALLALLFATQAFCQAPDAESHELTPEEEDLVAFVFLGRFYDRGIASAIERVPDNPHVKAAPKPSDAVPQELIDLLQVREKNVSDEPPPLLGWIPKPKDQSPPVAIERFRQHGLVELFFLENTKLLDAPLTQRKELMDRLEEIKKQAAPCWAGLMVRVHSETQLLLIASSLRSLSVELDMEIGKSLTPAERARVAKLASYLLPSAIEEAKKDAQKFALGSSIYDIHRPRANKAREK
jgi:hypothetical protein